VTKYKLVLFATVSLLTVLPARPQVLIDLAKITCEQFILWKVTDPQHIAIWLSGYYNGKRGNTVVDTEKLKENAAEVTNYCRANLKLTVMQSVEKVLGATP
jgi:acid stress chaperone HdeB